jgi:phage recombination protein Bet
MVEQQNALATKKQADEWTSEKRELAKRTICKGASNDEFEMFLGVCQRTGLDPWARQIYSIQRKQWDSKTRAYVDNMVTQVSIDGFRLIADRSNKYAGQIGPWWCGKDGEWKEIWLVDEPPAAAKVGVLRHDFQQPAYGIALYKSYVQTNNQGDPVSRWKTDPAGMLAKCAESLALRRAFPQELSGLYTTEEMNQADKEETVTTTWKPADTLTLTETTTTTQTEPTAQPETAAQAHRAASPITQAIAHTITMPDEPTTQPDTTLTYTAPLATIGKHKYPMQWGRLLAAYTRAPAFEVDGILQILKLPQETKPEQVVEHLNAYLAQKAAAEPVAA